MLSERLKEATKTAHQQLEKKMVGFIKAIHSIEAYASLLALFYSYFGGLEATVDKHIDVTFLPDYSQRRKTASLVADLHQLKAAVPALAGPQQLPQISNHLQAMGTLYVMEGSTLGGKIIGKMIGSQLQLPAGYALSFFNGYGEATGAMWNAFQAALNKPLTLADEAVVIQAANDTFIQFSHRFDQHYL